MFFLVYLFVAVIDVASGEYGHEYIDKMISSVDNGRCLNWTPYDAAVTDNNYRNEKNLHSQFIDELEEEINPKHLRARSSSWEQFWTLYKRRTVQMWRDSVSRLFIRIIYLFKSSEQKITIISRLIFLTESHKTTNLHDILPRPGGWGYLSRHRK